MSVATAYEVREGLIPGLRVLRDDLERKSREWETIVKIGRTHLMDAVPITLGQEFGGYAQQMKNSLLRAKVRVLGVSPNPGRRRLFRRLSARSYSRNMARKTYTLFAWYQSRKCASSGTRSDTGVVRVGTS